LPTGKNIRFLLSIIYTFKATAVALPLTRPSVRLIALLQGGYWFITGVWPLLHLPSFLWVTGPKEDIWLLYTVSVLISVIGGVLLLAGLRRHVSLEIKWLGMGGAAGLAGIDIYYALNDVIWDVYLLDAVAEVLIIGLWLWAGRKGLSGNNTTQETHQANSSYGTGR